ncbi:helix-turn-helix domain-containing protein [Aquimarina sp. I32.4]|uniref:helix-turn-helix domain-containing protein n=1 Tax=Aquimarina sp. I32.4 TaxID=2053903 RepID=UPI000CDE8393|nr:helix-turn-helix domain-containing protein [Aquimarina sp. I32.4]
MKKQDKLQQRIQLIGKRIKKLRIDGNYTSYEKFAIAKGIDRKQYWRLEKGSNFTMATLINICDFHNISLEEFFEGL